MQAPQPQNKFVAPITMSPSQEIFTDNGVLPLVLNFEPNNVGNLVRRRGTVIEKEDLFLDGGGKFITAIASSSSKLILRHPSPSQTNEDFPTTAILTLYKVENSSGVKEYMYNVFIPELPSWASGGLEQSTTTFTDIPEIAETFGISADANPNIPNTIFFNDHVSHSSSPTNIPIGKVVFALNTASNTIQTTIARGNTGISIPTISNIAAFPKGNSFYISPIRTFYSAHNMLFYNKAISPTPSTLDGSVQFEPSYRIVKVIDFDGQVFVFTINAVYKGILSSGEFIFQTISNDVNCMVAESIILVGNFAYVPSVSGAIYRVNLKSSQLEVDSYINRIGGQVASLVAQCYPISGYFDDYNSSINFVYRGSGNAINAILRHSDPTYGDLTTDFQERKHIVLSKSYANLLQGYETWSCAVYNFNVVGSCKHLYRKLPEIKESSLDHLSFTENNAVFKGSEFNFKLQSSVFLIPENLNSIFKVSPTTRLDGGIQFPVVIGVPVSTNFGALITSNAISNPTLTCAITVDPELTSEVLNTNISLQRSFGKAWLTNIVGVLSSTPAHIDDINVFVRNAIGNTVVLGVGIKSSPVSGCVFVGFKSSNISTFLGFIHSL